ncbi:MAG: hypothetical protein JWL90_1647 [Chthoniobacteraceae bacterium]|nr:hypothetical protein [Chthoniobacteraceae bacterium]
MKPILLLIACLLFASPAFAFDPPPLEKLEATRILEAMEWKEITLIAIRQGETVQGAPSPISATVLGLGTLDGKHQKICLTISFDNDLKWHVLELNQKSARLWTKEGYREIKPWATW